MATFWQITSDVSIGAWQSIRRNAGDSAFEAYTPSSWWFTSAARAYRNSTNQTISSTAATKVQLNAESYDISNEFDSTTNYRFTATNAWRYIVEWHIRTNNIAVDSDLYAYIYINWAVYTRVAQQCTVASSNFWISINDILNLSANDYVELYVSSSDSSYDVLAWTSWPDTYMSIARIQ